MDAFFQGKLDNFCALYAVLNAMQRTHGINHWAARKLFHTGLIEFARDETIWKDVVTNSTDYISEIETFIEIINREGINVEYIRPFSSGKASIEEVHTAIKDWSRIPPDNIDGISGQAVVLQFKRYLPFRGSPLISHWTAVSECVGNEIRFIDSSLEKMATYTLPSNGFCTHEDDVKGGRLFLIDPSTIYLLKASD